MRTLTEFQKQFLLIEFFANEKYAGWKGIAESLLDEGECIVSGTECIWVGGIGNFIKVEQPKKFNGCCLYKFDIESFFKSEWYKDIVFKYSQRLLIKKNKIDQEYAEISKIL